MCAFLCFFINASCTCVCLYRLLHWNFTFIVLYFCGACLWVQSKASPVLLWATAEVWNSLLTSNTHSGTLRTALIFLTPKPRLCLGRTLKCQSNYKQDKPPSRACENTPAHNHFHWGDLWLCFLWHWSSFDGKLC